MYFGPEVDVAIIAYNAETDFNKKSIIYEREIRAAFEKLVENIIHTFKFYYTDNVPLLEVQHEVVSFLVEKLSKFKPEKGSKAFSYYSIVAKNYCILKNRKNYKKLIEHKRIDINTKIVLVQDEPTDNPDLEVFFEKFIAHWEYNLPKYYTKPRDIQLSEAVLELFRRRVRIEEQGGNFNKKALYVYIREMTNANTQQITKIVKQMKYAWKKMFSDFLHLGYLPKDKIYDLTDKKSKKAIAE
tara:strand:- start:631 stop:1356 length:726 start_codon:yes stop_codon:yes gene_type:complete